MDVETNDYSDNFSSQNNFQNQKPKILRKGNHSGSDSFSGPKEVTNYKKEKNIDKNLECCILI